MCTHSGLKTWLPPALLILFVLELLLFPLALGSTYASRSESPDHLLTYTTGALTWDSNTAVRADGVAMLDLFDGAYQNVQTQNGENLVAPGTEKTNIVRLKNSAGTAITYTALLYCAKAEETLPVEPQLAGSGFADTGRYPLPDDVAEDQVVRAVTGTLAAGAVQDFDIRWLWNYHESDARDQTDTVLGNKAAFADADDVTAGLYIVVEDESRGSGSYILPQTGDDNHLGLYLVLLGVSGAGLVLTALARRRRAP
nr:sortase B protein-sorting domain-containing protein [uncultured Gemmiger sp.]